MRFKHFSSVSEDRTKRDFNKARVVLYNACEGSKIVFERGADLFKIFVVDQPEQSPSLANPPT
jgi:hypothetical protein